MPPEDQPRVRPLRRPPRPDPAVDRVEFPRGRRERLKDAAGVWLERVGLAGAYVRARGVAGATILTYHSVAPRALEPWIDPRSRLSPQRFAEHLRLLRARRRVVPLDDVVDAVEVGRTLPAGTVAVTLDDGYRDLLDVVAPLAREHGVPMTAFVVTGWCDRGEAPWLDRLHALLRHRTRDVLWWPDDSSTDLRDPAALAAARARLEAWLIDRTAPERDARLAEVEAMLRPAGVAPRVVATWDELRTLRDAWPEVRLAIHTAEHPDCRTLDAGALRAELEHARARFQAELGLEARYLAFPYNRTDDACADVAAAVGLRACFASDADPLVVPGQRLHALPRLDAPAETARVAWVTSGAFPGLVRALGSPARALLGRR